MQFRGRGPAVAWPRDMTIRITEDDDDLGALLWARAVWGLAIAPDVPAVLDPSAAALEPPFPREDLSARCQREWDLRVAWLGDVDEDTDAFEEPLDRMVRRSAAWRAVVPEPFPVAMGEWWPDAAFRDWSTRLTDSVHAAMRFDDAERRALSDLVPAWRAGLQRLVVLPVVGRFARRIGPQVLMVSSGTRADDDAYGAALRGFSG